MLGYQLCESAVIKGVAGGEYNVSSGASQKGKRLEKNPKGNTLISGHSNGVTNNPYTLEGHDGYPVIRNCV